jgi:hypothetical protein
LCFRPGTLFLFFFSVLVSLALSQECCPKGAWGTLTRKEDAPYVDQGVMDEDVGGSGLNIYRVGNGTKCIVWSYGIRGFNGGRTKELADFFANKGK